MKTRLKRFNVSESIQQLGYESRVNLNHDAEPRAKVVLEGVAIYIFYNICTDRVRLPRGQIQCRSIISRDFRRFGRTRFARWIFCIFNRRRPLSVQFRCKFFVTLLSSLWPERWLHCTRSKTWSTFGTKKHLPRGGLFAWTRTAAKTERCMFRYTIKLLVELVVSVRKVAFWVKCTSFVTYLSSFPLRVCNNRVSLNSPDLQGKSMVR